jgi:hypothetical protein
MAKDLKKVFQIGSEKKYRTWSRSSNKDGYHKEIRVEEIENGYLVCLNEWGDIGGKYKDSNKKYYSKENPLSDKDIKTDDGLESAIDKFINSI